MFRTAELGQTVSRQEFKAGARQLRQRLLEAQILLSREAGFSVIIDFAGVDGAGKGSTVSLLHDWLDTRLLTTNAYGPLTEAQRERPKFWRFWWGMPPKGRIGLNLSGRYSQPILDMVNGRISAKEFDAELSRIRAFERALADDGTLVLKFWMHLSRDAQKSRLEALEADPEQAWRVSAKDWAHWEIYDRFIDTTERTITATNTEFAPWHIVEGLDQNFRMLTVSNAILNALETRLGLSNTSPAPELLVDVDAMEMDDPIPSRPEGLVTVLSTLDTSPTLSKATYRQKLSKQQGRVHLLQRKALQEGRSAIVVFEGPDAAGKGGVIRRIIPTLDARNYRVLQYGAPTDEEHAHHYLWRFWRHLSRSGRLTIFDRSWYGRVLVERVEGLASDEEWRRAYAEINEFEDQLIEHGTVLVKFWMHITPEEQLARFEDRKEKTYKRWKLTAEDWRNRRRWYDYEKAAHEMVKYTSTRVSPWELVSANDKKYARVTVLETYCDLLEKALEES